MNKWSRNYDKENLAPRNLNFEAWFRRIGEHFTLYCNSDQDKHNWRFGIGPLGVNSSFEYTSSKDAQAAAEEAFCGLLKTALSIVEQKGSK